MSRVDHIAVRLAAFKKWQEDQPGIVWSQDNKEHYLVEAALEAQDNRVADLVAALIEALAYVYRYGDERDMAPVVEQIETALCQAAS